MINVQYKVNSAVLVMLLAFGACNNYGLVEKLQNPAVAETVGKFYAFVTPQATLGDMSGLTNGNCTAATGLARADCSCTDYAKSAGLLPTSTGKFVGWMSNAANDMRCRIPGISDTTCALADGTYTWYNTSQEILATSLSDLFDSSLGAQLRYTQNGTVSSDSQAYSGTLATGSQANAGGATAHCSNWTESAAPGLARTGIIGSVVANWSDNASVTCDASAPIYCFAVLQK
jgi:hypothetical protein